MKGGQDDAGLAVFVVLELEAAAAPMAMEESMLGLSFVMKFPQMV